MKRLFIFYLVIAPGFLLAQKNASVSFEKWIRLKGVFGPVISPDGKTIDYTVGTTDLSNNSYDSELWMVREGQTPLQLTRTSKGSSFAARFTPDSRFVSFLADRGEWLLRAERTELELLVGLQRFLVLRCRLPQLAVVDLLRLLDLRDLRRRR